MKMTKAELLYYIMNLINNTHKSAETSAETSAEKDQIQWSQSIWPA